MAWYGVLSTPSTSAAWELLDTVMPHPRWRVLVVVEKAG